MLWSKLGLSEYEKNARANLVHKIVENIEPQLGTSKCISSVADKLEQIDLNDTDAVIAFLNEARKPYLASWPTCLEFYTGSERKQCTDSMLAVMLATLIVDCAHPTAYKSAISGKLDDFRDQLGEDSVSAIRDRFDNMLANLVNPLEISYAP